MEMSAPEVYTLISPPVTELEVHFCLSSEQQGPGKGWGAALSTTVKNSQMATLNLSWHKLHHPRLRSCWGMDRVLGFARRQGLGSWGEGSEATGNKGARRILGTCLWLASVAGQRQCPANEKSLAPDPHNPVFLPSGYPSVTTHQD